ncbi:flagellar protein FlaG [Lentibacillus persicus]|uniref:Flagellar protein FlaG n=1 Tax=Lentibacillus persicus TaxID=640948 RepID=A0A1I1WTR9_9BACI|nr:flagellar protein FlaG [Lentibacillus persicus]SFD96843.1 flagellar protein FlaG [Lentibacillus persicus]
MKVDKPLRAVHPLQNEQHSRYTAAAAKEKSAESSSNTDQQKKKNMDKDQIETIVAQLNDFMEPTRTSLKFELHDKLNDYYVKVIDRDTEEVIREIPPEKMLDMHAAMEEFAGFLIDEKI